MNEQGIYTTGQVRSADGTIICYRKLGSGPGLILVHGGLMAAQGFMKLGRQLSAKFTVYIPNRRGRGGSGPHGQEHSIEKEKEDLQALIGHTHAQYIYGLSAGAIITLFTAIKEPRLKKIAVYEPPFPLTEGRPAWLNKYEARMKKNDLVGAFLAILKGVSDPSPMQYMPDLFVRPLVKMAMNAERKRKPADHVLLEELVPTMHYDAELVLASSKFLGELKHIQGEVLLLNGTRSRDILRKAIALVSERLPAAKRMEFPGLGHIASTDHGKPGVIAKELEKFFG